MKKHLLKIFSLAFVLTMHGQTLYDNYMLTFENSSLFNHVVIPSNPGNKWQIGKPQKSLFTTAFSPTNVIVTDKTNPYPINDTSVFIIKNVADGQGFEMAYSVILAGKYYINSDTLTDFGKIEFSPNNGTTWIDLINTTTYSSSVFWSFKPTLTGNSYGWKDFYVNIAQLGPIFNIHDGDTILYKFSFISDGNQTNKDGLMYDDIYFMDFIEGIPELQNEDSISVFPNPSSDIITIKEFKKCSVIELYDFHGRLVYSDKNFSGQISIKTFPDGIYFLKYFDDKTVVTKRIIVRH